MLNTKEMICQKKVLIGILCSFVGISFLCNMFLGPTAFEQLSRKIDVGYYLQTFHIQDTKIYLSISPDGTHRPGVSAAERKSVGNKNTFINDIGGSKIKKVMLDRTNSVSSEFDECLYFNVISFL